MRSILLKSFFVTGLTLSAAISNAAPTLESLIKKAEDNLRGETFQGKIKMVILRDGSERTLSMRVWIQGLDLATIKITSPPKEKGVSNLRRQTDLWQYLPKVDRLIRIPSSMMLQNWMGSDFSNDDMVKSSSLVRDYSHKLLEKTKIDGQAVWVIESTPKPTTPVAWKKIKLYLREADAASLNREFFSEKGEIVKVMTGSGFKKFGDRTFPMKMEMKNPKKPGAQTTLEYDDIVFDQKISDDHFTQLFLKRSVD